MTLACKGNRRRTPPAFWPNVGVPHATGQGAEDSLQGVENTDVQRLEHGIGNAWKAAWINEEGRDMCTSCTHSHVHHNVLPGGGLLAVDMPFSLWAHHLLPGLQLIPKASLVAVPDQVFPYAV
ncbi:uncharacterized protein LOC144458558 isoform X2 [Epinephelus lanceolatus]